jgi:hypothetical protein
VSISLMIDKKAKRYVFYISFSQFLNPSTLLNSAMCLRIFGEDITIFGKEEAEKRRKNGPSLAEGAVDAVAEDAKKENSAEEVEVEEDERDDEPDGVN